MASGLTPTYNLPYPLATDPVDVHGDMEDLAQEVEDVLEIKADILTSNTFLAPNIFLVDSTSDAVRITQTGTGNALRVEDSANPDLTPFIIDSDGNTGIGTDSPGYKLHVAGDGYFSGAVTFDDTVTFNSTVIGLDLAVGESITFEGTTDDDNEMTLSAGDPTADRTLLLPDADDTIVARDTTDTLTNKTIDLANNTLTGTTAEFNTALSDDDFATLAGNETITNKSIDLANNTLTGTLAEFNTALSDDDFVSLTGTETLTNKTLTSPTISDPTFTGQITGVELAFGQSIVFEGTTDDDFEMTFSAGDPTADRSIALPDTDGTVITTGNLADITNLTSPTISDPTFTGQITGMELAFGQSIVFEGTTDDDFELTLTAGDPTADRTIALPDVDGTIITTGNENDLYPTQSGNAGFYLQTDGTNVSWTEVDALPDQTGNSGYYLTTDGSVASWAAVDLVPDQTGNDGKFLGTDGTNLSWEDIVGGLEPSDTVPLNPQNGQGWLDTTTGKAYVYYDDGDSQQWIEIGQPGGYAELANLADVDTSGVADGNALVYNALLGQWVPGEGGGGASFTIADTAPSGAEAGDVWFNSTTGNTYIYYVDYDSTAQWVEIASNVTGFNNLDDTDDVNVTGAADGDFLRYNSSSGNWENDAYVDPIKLNGQTISANYSIPSGYNGLSAGPITIADGVTVTIPDGSAWSVV